MKTPPLNKNLGGKKQISLTWGLAGQNVGNQWCSCHSLSASVSLARQPHQSPHQIYRRQRMLKMTEKQAGSTKTAAQRAHLKAGQELLGLYDLVPTPTLTICLS